MYQFLPMISKMPEIFVTWNNEFSDDELISIINMGNSLIPQSAVVGGDNALDTHKRVSEVTWIYRNLSSEWIYDRFAGLTRKLNSQFYQFDLWGFCEAFQFTVYNGSNEGHYDWHLDHNASDTLPPRKLSIVMQLSDPEEYEGGDLELFAHEIIKIPKKKGLIVAFPSYTPHRVAPVTCGIRRSLVIWTHGPKFV